MLDRFITPGRIAGYPKLIALMFAAIGGVWTLISLPHLVDAMGKPIGYDFMAFWSGGRMALDGVAADAYDPVKIFAAHRLAIPGVETLYLWHYPPPYFLAVAPFGAMPYLLALIAFIGLSLWAWAPVARAAAPDPRALWAIIALPAGLICLIHGQNGFLTAALAGGALLLLDKRPWLAGVLIGLLAIKPHLAILFPIALIASGRWRPFIAAAITGLTMCALSLVLLGEAPWRAFIENLAHVRAYVDAGWLPWGMMPTTYVLARSLELSPDIAQIAHGLVALCAAIAVFLVWRKKDASFNARAATFAAASLLISPYLFYYDLTLAGLAIAWLAFDALEHGAMPGEKLTLVGAYFAPILMVPFYALFGVQWGVLATLALLGYALARAYKYKPSPARGWRAETTAA